MRIKTIYYPTEYNFKYFKDFIIILIVSTNYIFVYLLNKKLFYSSLVHGTNMKIVGEKSKVVLHVKSLWVSVIQISNYIMSSLGS